MENSLYSVIYSLLQTVAGGSTVPSDAVILVAIVLTLLLTWLIVMYPVRIVLDWIFPRFRGLFQKRR